MKVISRLLLNIFSRTFSHRRVHSSLRPSYVSARFATASLRWNLHNLWAWWNPARTRIDCKRRRRWMKNDFVRFPTVWFDRRQWVEAPTSAWTMKQPLMPPIRPFSCAHVVPSSWWSVWHLFHLEVLDGWSRGWWHQRWHWESDKAVLWRELAARSEVSSRCKHRRGNLSPRWCILSRSCLRLAFPMQIYPCYLRFQVQPHSSSWNSTPVESEKIVFLCVFSDKWVQTRADAAGMSACSHWVLANCSRVRELKSWVGKASTDTRRGVIHVVHKCSSTATWSAILETECPWEETGSLGLWE